MEWPSSCSRPCFCKRATEKKTRNVLGDGVVTSFFDVFIEWPTSSLAHAQVANYATRSSLDTSFCERTNVVLKPTVTFGLGLVDAHYRDGPSLFTSEQLTWSLPDGETLALRCSRSRDFEPGTTGKHSVGSHRKITGLPIEGLGPV